MSVDNVRALPPDDPGQLTDPEGIRDWWVMQTASRVHTRQAHGHGREPVHAHSRWQHLFVQGASHSLGGDRDLMATAGESVREIEHVPLLTANVRREELGEQEDPH
jgi:hypothetical protein